MSLSVTSIRWREPWSRAAQERWTSGPHGPDLAAEGIGEMRLTPELGSLDWALVQSYSCKQEQEQENVQENGQET